jgi:hypothetical protein
VLVLVPFDMPDPVRFRVRVGGQDFVVIQMIASHRTETTAGGFGSWVGIGAKYKTVTEDRSDNAVLTTMPQAGTVEEARSRIQYLAMFTLPVFPPTPDGVVGPGASADSRTE